MLVCRAQIAPGRTCMRRRIAIGTASRFPRGSAGCDSTIRSTPPADVTEESLAELQRICKRASEVDGSYASWIGVAIAHAVHRLNEASSEVPSGQEVLQAAV